MDFVPVLCVTVNIFSMLYTQELNPGCIIPLDMLSQKYIVMGWAVSIRSTYFLLREGFLPDRKKKALEFENYLAGYFP